MAAKNLSAMSVDVFNAFLSSFDTVLCDCDGVLWLYDDVIQGSPEVINALKIMSKQVFYVTNNSTKTRQELVEKCKKLGYVTSIENVLSTAYLTACYLKDRKFTKTVYVIGTSGIGQELDAVGISHTGIGPDPLHSTLESLVSSEVHLEKDIGAVVVGFDPHFSFPKMLKAASYLSDTSCIFVATNTDERFPLKSNSVPKLVVPGTGSLVKAIETCAEREAIKIGKPNAHICDIILKRHNIVPIRTLMIGDRGNTDVLLGKRCGFQTLLVLSGVTTLKNVSDWKKSNDPALRNLVPDFYVRTLGDMCPRMNTS